LTTTVEESAEEIYLRVIEDYKRALKERDKKVSACVVAIGKAQETLEGLERILIERDEVIRLQGELIELYHGGGDPQEINEVRAQIDRRKPIGVE